MGQWATNPKIYGDLAFIWCLSKLSSNLSMVSSNQ